MSIITAAGNIICDVFFLFSVKKSAWIFHEHRLPADDAHEISRLIMFAKAKTNLLQILDS